MESEDSSCPHEFFCPISKELMNEPVIIADGHSFEKSAILQWFKAKKTNPITNLPLKNLDLIENRALKEAINCNTLREEQAHRKAKKAIVRSYEHVAKILPQMMNDSGLIDADQVIVLAVESQEMKKCLEKIKSILKESPLDLQIREIEKITEKYNFKQQKYIFETESEECKMNSNEDDRKTQKKDEINLKSLYEMNNQSLVDSHRLMMNKLNSCQPLLRSSFCFDNLSTDYNEIPYYLITCKTMKKIDYNSFNTATAELSYHRNYLIENQTVSTMINRIKMHNNISVENNIKVYVYNGTLVGMFNEIRSQMDPHSCQDNKFVEMLGEPVIDYQTTLTELGLKEGNFFILENLGNSECIFREKGTFKCSYCYRMRHCKLKCACGVRYCSSVCVEKDEIYHKKECEKVEIMEL